MKNIDDETLKKLIDEINRLRLSADIMVEEHETLWRQHKQQVIMFRTQSFAVLQRLYKMLG